MRFNILLFCMGMILIGIVCRADDSPGFFLKIAKNIPRLGRRSTNEFGSFFKNLKAVPRIGRSVAGENIQLKNFMSWLNNIPMPDKRVLLNNPAPLVEREYSVIQPVNSNTLIQLLERDAIPTETVKFVHWKDFDRALQEDYQLYEKLITLGRPWSGADQRLKQDLRLGTYIPIYSSSNDDDFMLYNREGDGNGNGLYNRDFLHYNHLN